MKSERESYYFETSFMLKSKAIAYRDLSKKWTVQVPHWAIVLSHLSVVFMEQLENVL
jgi:L-asparagine transporter-like permease